MSGHTPGPWGTRVGFNSSEEITAKSKRGKTWVIARATGAKVGREESKANALLIAEAPALLAFAKWAMVQLCGDSGTGESHWEQFKEFRDGQSAIAKAEGKQ